MSISFFRQHSKTGFTLVELSIVLVIIGLLIGGILVGQSLINSAKIQSQIRQFQQIDIAVSNFKSKYRYLPGDSPYHDQAGDGDGEVENTVLNGGTKDNTASSYSYELREFWRHLQQDNFLQNEYDLFSNSTASGVRVGEHMPHAILGDGSTGILPQYCNTINNKVCPRLTYYLANVDGTTGSNVSQFNSTTIPSINVLDVVALESKMDDGIAYVSNFSLYNPGNIYVSSANSNCYISSGTYHSYDIDSSEDCYLFVKMLITMEK